MIHICECDPEPISEDLLSAHSFHEETPANRYASAPSTASTICFLIFKTCLMYGLNADKVQFEIPQHIPTNLKSTGLTLRPNCLMVINL
jgi:hypothetical protein